LLNQPTILWDPSIAKCISGAGNCNLGFGGNTTNTYALQTSAHTCFSAKKDCSVYSQSSCTTQKKCFEAHGWWDTFGARNNLCVSTPDECNSGADEIDNSTGEASVDAGRPNWLTTAASDGDGLCDPKRN